MGYIMPKISLLKNSSGFVSPTARDKGVHTFPKGICLKENEIMRLVFELRYEDLTVQQVSHFIKGTLKILIYYQ